MPADSASSPGLLLHIAPTPFFSDRGCHIRIAGIVRSLQALGFDNHVATYHTGYDLDDIQTSRINTIKAYQKTSAGPSVYKILADFRLLTLSIRQVRALNPVALHAHLHEGVLIALLCRLWLRRKDLPITADMQGSLVGELDTYGFFNKVPFLKWPFRQLERWLLRSADGIVCSSEHALAKFEREFPESASKMLLAQDGADAPTVDNDIPLNQRRTQLGIPDNTLCAIYTGALLDSKGQEPLQELIRNCANAAAPVHFLIVGYPVEQMQAFIKAHSLEHSCTMTGRVEFSELAHYLALADVAIDPKRSDAGEGSGKMLNYLASGLPVIAFNTHNNLSFLGADTTLCNSVDDMRDQLMVYASNPQQLDKDADSNRQRFELAYSWTVTEKQLSQSYQALGLFKANA